MSFTPGRAVTESRGERVGEIVSRLKAGDFDAARYESTPRRRAEILAAVLSKALSRGALRRRLKRLGVAPEFQSAELKAVSVEGGGIDIRRPDGVGQVLTGPGIDTSLLAVFPELLPHTLTNATITLVPGASDAINSFTFPSASSNTKALWISFTLWLPEYLASAAYTEYQVSAGTLLPLGRTLNGTFTVTDPYGVDTLSGADVLAGGASARAHLDWNADGINFAEVSAEQTERSPGNKTVAYAGGGGGTEATDWVCGMSFIGLTLTYTTPPCLTCEITIEVSHGCSGSGLGGVAFTLSNGLTCTTNGAGECTISDIPDGEYTYTVTKTGFVSENGTFSCACLTGGSTVISIRLDPNGGCKPPPDPASDDPNGFWASVQGYARRWRYWFDGPVVTTQPYRRTDGDCGEDGGISVGSECDEEGGVSSRG